MYIRFCVCARAPRLVALVFIYLASRSLLPSSRSLFVFWLIFCIFSWPIFWTVHFLLFFMGKQTLKDSYREWNKQQFSFDFPQLYSCNAKQFFPVFTRNFYAIFFLAFILHALSAAYFPGLLLFVLHLTCNRKPLQCLCREIKQQDGFTVDFVEPWMLPCCLIWFWVVQRCRYTW